MINEKLNCGIFISDNGFGHMVRQRSIIKQLQDNISGMINARLKMIILFTLIYQLTITEEQTAQQL